MTRQERWLDRENLDSFLERLATTSLFDNLELRIDQVFVASACSLASDSLTRLLDALQTKAISRVDLYYADGAAPAAPESFQEVCKALGSNDHAKTLILPLVPKPQDILGPMIAHLKQVSKLVFCDWSGAHHVCIRPSFLASLQHHPSISKVFLAVPTQYYTKLLPVVVTFPALTTVYFRPSHRSNDITYFNQPSAQAIRHFLANTKPSLQHIRFQGIRFRGRHGSGRQHINSGKTSTIQCLELADCVWELFAGDHIDIGLPAFSDMPLRKLVIRNLEFPRELPADAMHALLGSGSTTFHHLEEFKFDDCWHRSLHMTEELVAFVRKLSLSPRLRFIELHLDRVSEGMDQALAECARSCPLLTTIDIQVPPLQVREQDYYAPALLKAIMTNYNIQVIFHFLNPADANSDTTKQIRMITNLNQAGRNYLALDGGNKRKGVNVLGFVSQNLDCLYFHLRENPLLCDRNDDLSPPRKKRKTDN